MKRRAYTIIELITVMAITAILLTIIVVPVFTSFKFTRQALAFSEAQQRAKEIADRLAKEVSTAAAIRDNGDLKGTLVLYLPGKTGALVPVRAGFAKLDVFPPAQQGQGDAVSGYVNPSTGKVDPTLKAPKGPFSLPVAPGQKMVRYAITLRDPFSDYNNPYDALFARGKGRDNLYVLRRFEVQPFKYDPVAKTTSLNSDQFYDLAALNTAAGALGFSDSLGVSHLGEAGPWLDDPDFLNPKITPYGAGASAAQLGAKAKMVRDWLDHSVVLTEVDHYDMVQAEFNKQTKQTIYEADGVTPHVVPLVQFKPSRVVSEAAQGQVSVRLGEESDNAGNIGPEVYRTQRQAWSNPVIRLYPDGWQSAPCKDTPDATDPSDAAHRYMVARPPSEKTSDGKLRSGLTIYSFNPDTEGCDETNKGLEVFDLKTYGNPQKYGFSEAISAANARSSWLTGAKATAVLANFAPFVPFSTDGEVRAGFSISEVGDPTLTPAVTGNLPTSTVNTYDPATGAISATGSVLSPLTDPIPTDAASHPYSRKDATNGTKFDVNLILNRIWAEHSELRPDVHRFLDLRTMPQSDGTMSPLDPINGYPRASLVPGSEEITGPDQNPGANYGQKVRYVRVTKTPGPNQYKINYTDQTEPDYAALGYAAPPATYDPTNWLSAVLQARYKAGYVQFYSDPNAPIPFGYTDASSTRQFVPLTVSYRFQFTRRQDVVAVDYDTRQLMNVLITVRSYPQSDSSVQLVTIPAVAKVRTVLQ